MAIMRGHIAFHQDILKLDGFLRDPVLVFGFQDCHYHEPHGLLAFLRQRARVVLGHLLKKNWTPVAYRNVREIPREFQARDYGEILANFGAADIKTLDFFDGRADYQHDMNLPVVDSMKDRFNTVIDIGSLEHVFDTRQCLANLFDMVKVDGHLVLHTPCNGFFGHGLHTFNPQGLIGAVEQNGFEIRLVKYTSDGIELPAPNSLPDEIVWIVARKTAVVQPFRIPQQVVWETKYGPAKQAGS